MQGPPKFTQIAIFGLKIPHLATLFEMRSTSFERRTIMKEGDSNYN
jgi:hypothetical protein